MKLFVLAAAGLIAVASPALAENAPKCLQANYIDHTHTVNTKTVLFYMKTGEIWQNDLPAACSGLNFHGFAIQGHDNEICAGQGIRLIESGQVCAIGNFTAYHAPAMTPSH